MVSGKLLNEPASNQRYKSAYAPIEDSDQPAHPHSLIKISNERFVGSQWSKVSSGGILRL